MKANEYQCYKCKKIYSKGLSEKEAKKQLEKEFGKGWKPEDCEVVCDDCYKEMFK